MNDLPKEWIESNIESLISKNGVFCDGDWIETKDQNPQGDVRLIQLADIGDGNFRDKSNRFLTSQRAEEIGCTYLHKGDALVARMPDPLGRACVFPLSPDRKYVTAVDVCIVRLNTKWINIKYLVYLINSPKMRSIIESYKSGTTRKRISRKNFAKILWPITSIFEQNQIADIVEELLSDLDNAIENLKKAQEQLKVYRRAILKKAFIGKWNKVPLQNISEAVGGCAFKSSSFKEQGVYQVIRIGNVRPGLIRLNVSPIFLDSIDGKTASKYLLIPGDVIISLTGTRKKRDYGYTAVVKERRLLLNQRLAYLRFNETCLPEFFLYYSWTESFKDSFFASETGNVGQGNVGMKAIQSTEIPLPSIQEQKQIVQSIESRFSVCDMMEESIVENLQKAEALRQSILKQAFEGNLTEQWRKKHKDLISGENSAEALLKKIKAEKEALQVKPKGNNKHD